MVQYKSFVLLTTTIICFICCSDKANGKFCALPYMDGPGTEMTRIINRLGLGSDCGRCKALAQKMDQGGPVWVRRNIDYVVAETTENAERLGHRMGPVKRLGIRMIVNQAILKSRVKRHLYKH